MSAAQSAGGEQHGRAYSVYVLVLLGLANGISFMDRGFLSLVAESVRETLQLSDTQMGLLLGPAFFLFYAIVALPLGRLADGYNRKRIVAAGIIFWSLCTTVTGVARQYAHVAIARMGLGLGEATLTPTAVSLLSDYFRRSQLGRAIATFTALGTLGAGTGLIVGGMLIGWLEKIGPRDLPLIGLHVPWQMAFMLIGLPGLVLGLLIVFTLREPPRTRIVNSDGTVVRVAWSETLRYMRGYPRATITVICGFALISAGSAAGQWMPTFFVRIYGMTPAEIGPWLGVIQLCCGVSGVVLGGVLADVLRRRGHEDANVRIALTCLCVVLPADLLLPNVGHAGLSLALFAVASFGTSICFGVGTSAIPFIVPPQMRAQVTAVLLLTANLVGLGAGPVIIPLITDYVFGYPAALRYSLTIVPGVLLPLSMFLLLGSRRAFQIRASELRDQGAHA